MVFSSNRTMYGLLRSLAQHEARRGRYGEQHQRKERDHPGGSPPAAQRPGPPHFHLVMTLCTGVRCRKDREVPVGGRTMGRGVVAEARYTFKQPVT